MCLNDFRVKGQSYNALITENVLGAEPISLYTYNHEIPQLHVVVSENMAFQIMP